MSYKVTQIDEKARDYSIIRECDGVSIPRDPNNRSFCEFLKWHNEQNKDEQIPRFRFNQPATFWCSETCGELIDHFKVLGCMLSCELNEEGQVNPIYKEHRDYANGKFYQLCSTTDYPVVDDKRYHGVYSKPVGVWVSKPLLNLVREQMKCENDDMRCLAAWPVERAFVYLDISDFSQYEPGEQALAINTLGWLSQLPSLVPSNYEKNAIADIESILCIGDGYIYCFTSALHATYFAARLANQIENHVAKKIGIEFHFRIGVHVGEVFRFWDIGRDGWNYVGDGINGGNRILSAIGKDMDDVVFVSNEVRGQLLNAESPDEYPWSYLLNAMQNRGRKSDKHGNMWRVYELSHMDIKV